MFERDRAQAVVTGIAGTQSTYGEEIVVSALSGPVALGSSQLFTSTDGFRRNADVENQLQSIYGKVALNESVSLQAELRRRQSDEGDLFLDYDPEIYLVEDEFRQDRNQDTAHLGATVELSPNSTLLAAGFYSERREKQRFSGLKDTPSEEGYQGELQHIWAEPAVRLTTGISTYNFNVHQEPPSFISEQGELVEPPAEDFDSGYAELYNYLNLNPHEMLDLTIGLAADHYNRGELDRNKISPKAGIMWSPMPELKLRAAALRTVKRSLVVEQTLEPTEVSGFTQFFDDFNGTVSELYGIGLDTRLASGAYAGIEASYRNLSVPIGVFDDPTLEDQDERQVSGYAYWIVNKRMTLTTELVRGHFHSSKSIPSFVPKQVDATVFSVGYRYRDASGLYADLIGNIVRQEIERLDGDNDLTNRKNTFFVMNATLGYRFPEQRGLFAIQLNNIFNQGFNYLDDSYRTNEFRATSPYLPERSVLARLTLNF